MNKLIIGIERIRGGQPRAYADSVYEAIFTFAAVGGVWIPEREQVLDYIKADYGHHFRVNPPEGNNQ